MKIKSVIFVALIGLGLTQWSNATQKKSDLSDFEKHVYVIVKNDQATKYIAVLAQAVVAGQPISVAEFFRYAKELFAEESEVLQLQGYFMLQLIAQVKASDKPVHEMLPLLRKGVFGYSTTRHHCMEALDHLAAHSELDKEAVPLLYTFVQLRDENLIKVALYAASNLVYEKHCTSKDLFPLLPFFKWYVDGDAKKLQESERKVVLYAYNHLITGLPSSHIEAIEQEAVRLEKEKQEVIAGYMKNQK